MCTTNLLGFWVTLLQSCEQNVAKEKKKKEKKNGKKEVIISLGRPPSRGCPSGGSPHKAPVGFSRVPRLRGRSATGSSSSPEPGGSRSRVMTGPFILYCLSELKYYLWRSVPSGKKKKRARKKSSLTELTQPLLLGQ